LFSSKREERNSISPNKGKLSLIQVKDGTRVTWQIAHRGGKKEKFIVGGTEKRHTKKRRMLKKSFCPPDGEKRQVNWEVNSTRISDKKRKRSIMLIKVTETIYLYIVDEGGATGWTSELSFKGREGEGTIVGGKRKGQGEKKTHTVK